MAGDVRPNLSDIRAGIQRVQTALGHAYTYEPVLLSALDAVLALHPKQRVVTGMVDGRVVMAEDRCLRCYSTGVWPGRYPCMAVRAIGEHIDLEG